MQPNAEDETPGRGLSRTSVRMLAGLDVGLFAGLPAIAWLLFHSWLRGEPWWAKLNVAGALFFGGSVYTMGFGRATLAGFALLVAGYALLGVLFGLAARPRGIARNLILGLFVAVAWQLICQQYLLSRLDSFAPAYFPPLSTLPAQMMFGIGLARFGPRFQLLASDFGDPSWLPAPPSEPPPPEPVPQSTMPAGEISPPETAENPLPDNLDGDNPKRSQETDC
jgi:hypothetical protein